MQEEKGVLHCQAQGRESRSEMEKHPEQFKAAVQQDGNRGYCVERQLFRSKNPKENGNVKEMQVGYAHF